MTCPICNRPLCQTAFGDSTDYEQRARCYKLGYERLCDEVNEQREAKEAAYGRLYKALAALEAKAPWSVRVEEARAAISGNAAPNTCRYDAHEWQSEHRRTWHRGHGCIYDRDES